MFQHQDTLDPLNKSASLSDKVASLQAILQRRFPFVQHSSVAVADIFDALTSRRPYKEAWSNDQAFDMLRRMAGTKVDQDCVEALIRCRTSIEDIQAKFQEDPYG
jgi:hypothetical protein